MATFRHEGSPEASPGTNLVSEPSDVVEAQGEESLRLEESKELDSDTLQVFDHFNSLNITLRSIFKISKIGINVPFETSKNAIQNQTL